MCNKQATWVILSLTAFAITLTLNYLSTSGVFNSTDQKELSDKYSLPITPPGFVFGVTWPLIYLWQTSWQIQLLFDSIKYSPELKQKGIVTFGTLFYVAWIASDFFNGSWIIVFSFEYLSIALVLIMGITVSLYVAAIKAHKYLAPKDLKEFENVSDDSQQTRYPLYLLRSPCRITSYRVLLLNGICFYLTWLNIATCLNIGIVFAFVADLNVYVASNIALSVLLSIVLVYIFLDFYYLREYLVFTYSPYFILIFALSGILSNSGEEYGDLKGVPKVLVTGLLILSGLSLVYKIISGIYLAIKEKKLKQSGQDYSLMPEKV